MIGFGGCWVDDCERFRGNRYLLRRPNRSALQQSLEQSKGYPGDYTLITFLLFTMLHSLSKPSLGKIDWLLPANGYDMVYINLCAVPDKWQIYRNFYRNVVRGRGEHRNGRNELDIYHPWHIISSSYSKNEAMNLFSLQPIHEIHAISSVVLVHVTTASHRINMPNNNAKVTVRTEQQPEDETGGDKSWVVCLVGYREHAVTTSTLNRHFIISTQIDLSLCCEGENHGTVRHRSASPQHYMDGTVNRLWIFHIHSLYLCVIEHFEGVVDLRVADGWKTKNRMFASVKGKLSMASATWCLVGKSVRNNYILFQFQRLMGLV